MTSADAKMTENSTAKTDSNYCLQVLNGMRTMLRALFKQCYSEENF